MSLGPLEVEVDLIPSFFVEVDFRFPGNNKPGNNKRFIYSPLMICSFRLSSIRARLYNSSISIYNRNVNDPPVCALGSVDPPVCALGSMDPPVCAMGSLLWHVTSSSS